MSVLLRAARSLGALPWAQRSGSLASAWQPAAAFSSAQAAPADNPFYAVPEGHQQSDLSDSACNIGALPCRLQASPRALHCRR